MNITLAEQLRGFWLSLGAGVLFGAVYDVFSLIRVVWAPPKRQLFLLDMISMLVLGLLTELLLLAVSSGEIRLYPLLGEALGFFAYR